jgi:hypothetical protein
MSTTLDPCTEALEILGKYRLSLQPITLKEANVFIRKHHRHHNPPCGYKFAIAVNNGVEVVGVATVGRPVARHYDDGYTAEVTRLCTTSTPHVASKLYAACWRAARAMGYRRLITYTLLTEPGTSTIAAGFKIVHQVQGRSWDRSSRPRVDSCTIEDRLLWEVTV